MLKPGDIVEYNGTVPKCGNFNEKLIRENLKVGVPYTVYNNGGWISLVEDIKKWVYPPECFFVSRLGFKKRYGLK